MPQTCTDRQSDLFASGNTYTNNAGLHLHPSLGDEKLPEVQFALDERAEIVMFESGRQSVSSALQAPPPNQ